jgi:hypothetical protein
MWPARCSLGIPATGADTSVSAHRAPRSGTTWWENAVGLIDRALSAAPKGPPVSGEVPETGIAPLGRRKMHVRVKFVDGRAGSRDTARHPFEGQPHGGSRRAKCPHLVDIRGEGPPNARWVCLGPGEPTDSRSARADSAPAWERRAERGSRLPETAPRPAARSVGRYRLAGPVGGEIDGRAGRDRR